MGLLAASGLLLFLELALIRWLPAHVLYLTFFTNVILLGSFLGLALGCLRARARDLSGWTAPAVALTMALAHLVERLRPVLEPRLDVGGQSAPQVVFFGAELARADLAPAPIPIELLGGLFFLLTAACLYGPGQELGRRLEERGGGTAAYGLNLLGSLAGVLAFALLSRLELSPFWWLLPVALGFELLARGRVAEPGPSFRAICWFAALSAAALTSGPFTVTVPRPEGPLEVAGLRAWSPYYRIDWFPPPYGDIRANLLGHQRMTPLAEPDPTYALPHLLRRDAGGAPFADVLVIGAGSGNDVARALQFGAASVDAVEIDPAIQRIGAAAHPDSPYGDRRVRAVVADGREFLERPGGRRYDLIVYALVDSLVLHSGYSNLRLESHLFTEEALAAAKGRLKPGGVLVLYNFYRQGWVAGRIHETLRRVFGAAPLTLTSPHRPVLDTDTPGGFTVFMAGDTAPIAAAFARSPLYRVEDGPPRPRSMNGFRGGKPLAGEQVTGVALSEVRAPADLAPATDDWPFLYLRRAMLPGVTLRGMAVMGALAALLLLGAAGPDAWRRASPRLFFLGAGFMLLETRAVVAAARWFGGTWTVNAAVFAVVLLALWAANLLAARLKARSLAPWYAALFAALALSALLPASALEALPAALRPGAAALLFLAPLPFAGVVFSTLYARSKAPAEDFAANVAGAMAGGLAENLSLLLGFRGLALAAAAFYAASLWERRRS